MTPLHLLIALLVPLTWGFGFVLAKAGLAHFPPLLLMGLRFLIAALILVWFVKLPRGHWPMLTLIAMTSATLQYGLTFSGLARMDATPAILLIQSEVVFGAVIAALMLRERPTRRQVFGMTVSIGGIATIVGAPSLEGQFVGICLVLSGCLFWAFGQVLVRRLGDALNGFQLTAWIGMIAAPQMLFASALIEGNPLPVLASASASDWLAVAYLGVIMTVIGYSAWYFILARYPVPMAMPVLLLLPVSTILGAISFLGERPGTHVMLGGLIVIGGVAAVIVDPGQLRRLVSRRTG